MNFKVGPWTYKVRLAKGLKDAGGEAIAGAFDWDARTIWLNAQTNPRRRRNVLFHELRHAWHHELGRVLDDENDANQVSSFSADVNDQLARQGGELALMRMTLDGVIDQSADMDAPGEPRCPQCPACGGMLDLPIRGDTPEFDARHARMVQRRSADCDFCGHTVTWVESVSSTGVSTGHVIGDPSVHRTSETSAAF